ncbi:MAG: beta-lactamase family protein [Myxococcaceae bacterium]|nr:beta-lactamase family protein [Myxococcaceae bacterium]
MRVLLVWLAVGCGCLGPARSLHDDTGRVEADAGTADAGVPGDELDVLASRYVGAGSVTFTLGGPPESAPQLPVVVMAVVSDGFDGVLSRSSIGEPAFDGRTVFPLSSVTKAFTGLLAARDAVDGTLRPTSRLSSLLKPDLAPLVGDRTVAEVLTHTAGFGVFPRNLAFATMPTSPAAGYSRGQLAACLADPQCAVGPAVRGQYLYSNLGLGLLGVALEDARDESFEQLVQRRIAAPLGLHDTHTAALSDSSRWPMGRTQAGLRVPPATMGVLAPAGELFSTADDLRVVLRALVRRGSALQPAIDLAITPLAPPSHAWGFDRVTLRGLALASKSGEQAGFSSMLLWSPTRGVGVAAFTTVGGSSRTLAAACLDVLERAAAP